MPLYRRWSPVLDDSVLGRLVFEHVLYASDRHVDDTKSFASMVFLRHIDQPVPCFSPLDNPWTSEKTPSYPTPLACTGNAESKSAIRRESALRKDEVFAGLPNELIHVILGLAAQSDPETCRTLCLVARWVRITVIPHLRKTVILNGMSVARKVECFVTMMSSLPPGWAPAMRSVTNLWFDTPCWSRNSQHARAGFIRIMTACPNIRKLAIPAEALPWLHDLEKPSHGASTKSDMELTIIDAHDIDEAHAPTPSLNQVTRLHLSSVRTSFDIEVCERLTHFAVDVMLRDLWELNDLVQKLKLLARLKSVVIVCHFDPEDPDCCEGLGAPFKDAVAEERKRDGRFCLLYELKRDGEALELLESWKNGAEGNVDVWRRAAIYSAGIGLL